MKKIFIVPFLLLNITACSFGGIPTGTTPSVVKDFSALYTDHVKSQIQQIDKMAQDFGLSRQEETKGTFLTSVDVPLLMSGSLGFDYDLKMNGRNSDTSLTNNHLAFESIVSSGSIDLKQLAMISREGDTYFRFDTLRDGASLITEEMKKAMLPYNNVWLSYTQADIEKSMMNTSPDEALSMNMAKNLSKMTLADVE